MYSSGHTPSPSPKSPLGFTMGLGARSGFKEIVRRCDGRYELNLKAMDGVVGAAGELCRAIDGIGSVVKGELRECFEGQEYTLHGYSLVIALAGSSGQQWHVDGPHLDRDNHRPCHCLNVFVPLVDMTMDMGPTEIKPGTHKYTRDTAKLMLGAKARGELLPPVAPVVKAGEAVCFDYRVLHRGLSNLSEVDRPVLVLTYAVDFFKDIYNFPTRSLKASVGLVWDFITDVEGHWNYFGRMVRSSRSLVWAKGTVELRDGTGVVFGGDAVDKGTGDIRIVKIMVDLKKRYGARVVIVLGNRDVNKLRFGKELTEERLVEREDIFWNPKHVKFEDWDGGRTLVNKLKWMLSCTMGAGGTFESRRAELEILGDGGAVTDEEVMNSFIDSVNPDGGDPWMLELVKCGVIVHVEGDSLYVHGGVNLENFGKVVGGVEVPLIGEVGKSVDIRAWAKTLNDWKDKELQEYMQDWRGSGGKGLSDYGVPGGARGGGGTVICAGYLENGNCKLPEGRVVDALCKNKIKRVFCGHQPQGEFPSVMRAKGSPGNVVLFVLADTSYSHFGFGEGNTDNRGDLTCRVSAGLDWIELNGGWGEGLDGEKKFGAIVRGEKGDGIGELVGRQLGGGEDLKELAATAGVGEELADGGWVKGIVWQTEGKVALYIMKGKGKNICKCLVDAKDRLKMEALKRLCMVA